MSETGSEPVPVAGSRQHLRWAMGGLCVLFLAVGVPLGVSWQRSRARAERLHADIERLSREALEGLAPDSEAVRRFGALQSLEGFEQLSPYHVRRQAVFEKTQVPVEILVRSFGPPAVAETYVTPGEHWLKKNPAAAPVMRFGEVWIVNPDGSGARLSIVIGLSHPDFEEQNP